jgi:hypothetical protein
MIIKLASEESITQLVLTVLMKRSQIGNVANLANTIKILPMLSKFLTKSETPSVTLDIAQIKTRLW